VILLGIGFVVLIALVFFCVILVGFKDRHFSDSSEGQAFHKEGVENIIIRKVPRLIRDIEKKHPLKIEVSIASQDSMLKSCDGYYKTSLQKMVVKEGASASLVLHEYGHFVDYSLMPIRFSQTEEWKDIFTEARSYASAFFLNRIKSHFGSHYLESSEFFAECFARFYFSRRSQERLKKLFPEAYRYFENLERRALQATS